MNKDQFITAIEIISKFHSTGMVVNKPQDNFVGGLGSQKWAIHITECCAGCTEALMQAGYHLNMEGARGLMVSKY